MTHLPECDYERQDYRGNDNRICYCSRLRLAYQRGWSDGFDEWCDGFDEGDDVGYRKGRLSAFLSAEAAVTNYQHDYESTLAAIRELRKEK